MKVKLTHMVETKFFALPPHKTYDAEKLPDGRYRIFVNVKGMKKDIVSVIVDKNIVQNGTNQRKKVKHETIG